MARLTWPASVAELGFVRRPRAFSPVSLDLSITLRLGAQRALWGQVPASLRAVSVALAGQQVCFRCFFDSGACVADQELLSAAAGELLGDFPAGWTVAEEFSVVPAPEPMAHLEHLVFLRHEPPSTPHPVA